MDRRLFAIIGEHAGRNTGMHPGFQIVSKSRIICYHFAIVRKGVFKKGGRQAFCCSPRFRTAMLPTPDQAENHRFAVTRARRRVGGAGGSKPVT